MATYTQNINLKKPDPSDFYNIEDFNENSNKIDAFAKTTSDHIANKQNPHNVTLDQVLTASGGGGGSVVPVTAGGTGANNAASARTNLGVPPTSHAVNAATYGKGSASVFGHVKLSDSLEGTNKAASGIAASEYALGHLAKVVLGGLEAFTFAEISAIGAAGNAPNYFKRGDTKTIRLKNNEQVILEIADFNHDDLTSGGKAPISFIIKNCLSFTGTRYMNSTSTNAGSWNSSYMRNTVMAEIRNQLPDDLKPYIKKVNKKTTRGNSSTAIQTTSDDLWLPSCIEVGTLTYGAGYVSEGTQYPIFTDDGSRIKLYNGSASRWWLRSPNTGSDAGFHGVTSGGSGINNLATNTCGVVFGLCI